jgi:hypothetical protein
MRIEPIQIKIEVDGEIVVEIEAVTLDQIHSATQTYLDYVQKEVTLPGVSKEKENDVE